MWINPLPVAYTPQPEVPYVTVRTKINILEDLSMLDIKSIRALCEQDTTRLALLEQQKVALRIELKSYD